VGREGKGREGRIDVLSDRRKEKKRKAIK